MNKLTLLLSMVLAAGLSASVYAADAPSGMEMGQMKGETQMGKKKMMGDCLMDRDGMGGECLMLGRHKMTGKVAMINHEKGTLVLKNSVADMTLHFPSDAIRKLKDGDTITVYLGFRMAEPPELTE